MLKLFVIRKYVMATSAKDAIKKEKSVSVDDVWLDDDWKKGNIENIKPIGFNTKKKKQGKVAKQLKA